MAITDLNREDRLVQQRFADHLRDPLDWERANRSMEAEVKVYDQILTSDGRNTESRSIRSQPLPRIMTMEIAA